jgi:hypothetical protein
MESEIEDESETRNFIINLLKKKGLIQRLKTNVRSSLFDTFISSNPSHVIKKKSLNDNIIEILIAKHLGCSFSFNKIFF